MTRKILSKFFLVLPILLLLAAVWVYIGFTGMISVLAVSAGIVSVVIVCLWASSKLEDL